MELNVNPRAGQKAKFLIQQGLIPAIVYGKQFKAPMSVSCIKNDFIKRYKEAGYSTPITLKGKDIDQMVLIQEIQVNPVTNNLIHVDFLAVQKDQKVKTKVPVVLIGESSIEKLGEGKIQIIKNFIEVDAFPQDLPHNVTIDISVIKTMNDTIFVKDLKFSDKVHVLDTADQAVVTVVKLAEEEIEEVVAAPVAGAEGAEGAVPAEGAEGAVPAEGAAAGGAAGAAAPAAKAGDKKAEGKDSKKDGKDDKKDRKDDKKDRKDRK